MPLKPNVKREQDLAYPKSENNGEVKTAGLFIVNEDGSIDTSSIYGTFLLNPTSLEETKNSNWVQHNISGQSSPVLQWTSSGAKMITFEALVTKDISRYSTTNENSNKIVNVQKYVADIASRFAQVAINIESPVSSNVVNKDLDISYHLNYYRSLLYPTYKESEGSRRLDKSPPRLILLFGNSVTTLNYGDVVTSKNATWVLSDLKIRTTKMLPNLAPMEAVVSFTLVQYNQESTSFDDFE